eukprot:TRINITY_DN67701_c8_g21_i1.p1 TRINITY_DN67701_c8_g21~~TRINITY_DN67701_c8_g21_i1.p1  ORF type:complete len:328 (-),score=1.87 TRINITY_DN67701_c8_g21_i1:402-1385(-)
MEWGDLQGLRYVLNLTTEIPCDSLRLVDNLISENQGYDSEESCSFVFNPQLSPRPQRISTPIVHIPVPILNPDEEKAPPKPKPKRRKKKRAKPATPEPALPMIQVEDTETEFTEELPLEIPTDLINQLAERLAQGVPSPTGQQDRASRVLQETEELEKCMQDGNLGAITVPCPDSPLPPVRAPIRSASTLLTKTQGKIDLIELGMPPCMRERVRQSPLNFTVEPRYVAGTGAHPVPHLPTVRKPPKQPQRKIVEYTYSSVSPPKKPRRDVASERVVLPSIVQNRKDLLNKSVHSPHLRKKLCKYERQVTEWQEMEAARTLAHSVMAQ